MRLRSLILITLASLPLAAGATASASASISIRVASKEWLATHDSRMLATPRTIDAISKGTLRKNGASYLVTELNGNTYRFEVPNGTKSLAGQVTISYVPLYDQGRQRLVATSINNINLR